MIHLSPRSIRDLTTLAALVAVDTITTAALFTSEVIAVVGSVVGDMLDGRGE